MLRRVFLLSIGAFPLAAKLALAETTPFAVGQVWSLKAPMDTNARIRVGRVENGGLTVHVSLWGVPIPEFAGGLESPLTMSHLPISSDALIQSVDHLVDETPPSDIDFEGGYQTWKEDPHAGVFTIPIDQVVAAVLETVRSGRSGQSKE